MRYEQVAAALACTVLITAGCKKDEEASPPIVTILAPAQGFSLTAPDTLTATAQVSDDRAVEQVTFAVLDANGLSVVTPSSVRPSTNPSTITVAIPLTADRLLGGALTLLVSATDGSTEGKDYRSFTLIPTPLRMRAALVVSTNGPSTVMVQRIDSAGNSTLANTLASDLCGSAISSWDQRTAVAGRASGPLQCFTADATTPVWQVSNPGNGTDHFTSLDHCADGRFYVGTADGRLTAKDPFSGMNKVVMDLAPDERTDRVITMGDKVVCITHQFGAPERHITAYLAASGALFTRFATDIDARALFARDDDHVLIFGDQNGTAVVQDLSVSGGGGWFPRTWPSAITAVERVDANTYAVALADGGLERFTYSNATSVPLASGVAIVDMDLDPVNGELYALTLSGLNVLDATNGQVLNSFPVNGTPARVHVLLNR